MHLTKTGDLQTGLVRQAGTIESYNGRGVWVPQGMTAGQIMAGADVLEQTYDVAPYTSRNMVIAILEAIRL